MKRLSAKAVAAALFGIVSLSGLFCQTKQEIKEGTILHCWCWSFKTIEANLEAIKAAGFTSLQTSPVNTCVVGDYGDLNYMSDDTTGKWYYHYQPTDWKIGNYQLGTEEEFTSMMKKANELGIGVIVDVLPNHTTPRINQVSQELIDACGGLHGLYHKNDEMPCVNYSDRLQCTTYRQGGLPDVNTENPLFQAYYMRYVNQLVDLGVDGFRYDTAKHIGLPDDPKDLRAKKNNFWPVFTGKEALNGEYVHNADNLFIYGEVLQGGNAREDAYAKYFPTTASTYGADLRFNIRLGNLSVSRIENMKHPVPEQTVTWIESHDTYANRGESAQLTNWQLRTGWAIIAARKNGTPLFFNRPQGPEAVQFPGVSKIGDIGNDQFMHPEVVAVNNFRNYVRGEPEKLFNGESNKTLFIQRGEKGIVMINVNTTGAEKVNIQIALPDGEYTDHANGIKFKVNEGVLTGRLPHDKICVIY